MTGRGAGRGGRISVTNAARRLLERRSTSPVLSVYIDLDPEEFATQYPDLGTFQGIAAVLRF